MGFSTTINSVIALSDVHLVISSLKHYLRALDKYELLYSDNLSAELYIYLLN